jgi:DNA (cytosine-5)-methyltransferase 1
MFDGVIGGPPCQVFSKMRSLNPWSGGFGDMIPEFERICWEAHPRWWLAENVPQARDVSVKGYQTQVSVVNNRWFGGVQDRTRKFCFGTRTGQRLRFKWGDEPEEYAKIVLGGHGSKTARLHISFERRSISEMLRLQGLPEDFAKELPFTDHAMRRMIGNGVPRPMGIGVAQAVKTALVREGLWT